MKFQGDILNFYDFIQVFVLTTNHHLNKLTGNSHVELKSLLTVDW